MSEKYICFGTEGKMMRCNRKNILIVLLMFILAISVTGCRESLVLTQILHNQQAEEQDTENDTKVAKNNEQSQQEDENLTKKKDSESNKKDNVKKEASKKGTQKNDGDASKTKQDNNSDNDKESDSDSNGNGKDDGEGSSGNEGNNGESSEGDSSAGAGGDRQIYDDEGNLIDLPEKVNSVVVAGSPAVMVQMLGGKGIVTGTSADITGNSLATTVFEDEDLGKAKTYWSGNGSTPMDNSSFSSLLEEKPDVCIGVGGKQNFSDSQISQLKSKKIAYVTIPAFNTASNIERATEILGKMIGDRSGETGGINAKKQATKYLNYCDDLTNDVKSTCGLFTWNNTDFNNDYSKNGRKTVSGASSNGKYTLYVSGWDNGAYFSLSANDNAVYSENGVAVSPNGYSGSPISYYMSLGGVCNNGARFSESNCKEYAAIPLNINVLKPTVNSSVVSYYKPTNESFLRYWVNSDSDDGIGLGSSKFPAVVVDSAQTKNSIQSSGMWKNYGKTTLGNRTDYGFVSGDTMVTTVIRGDYDVYVNPYGVTGWAEGSAESVLESIWTGWRISGKYSESAVRNEIDNFYSEFYRYNLSDSEINSILTGK